jgi:hypothetical protein
MKSKPCCQNNKQGSKKELSDQPGIFIKKYEDLFSKKVPDGG